MPRAFGIICFDNTCSLAQIPYRIIDMARLCLAFGTFAAIIILNTRLPFVSLPYLRAQFLTNAFVIELPIFVIRTGGGRCFGCVRLIRPQDYCQADGGVPHCQESDWLRYGRQHRGLQLSRCECESAICLMSLFLGHASTRC